MKYKEELIEFLAKSENLEIALEIADNIDLLKRKIESIYWEKLKGEIAEKMNADGEKFAEWKVILPDLGEKNKGYSGLYVYQEKYYGNSEVDPQPKFNQLIYCFEKEVGGVYFGVIWSDPNSPKVLDLKAESMQALITELSDLGFKNNRIWLGYKFCINLDSSGLKEISKNPNCIVEESAKNFLSLFEETKETVEKVNIEILESYGNK